MILLVMICHGLGNPWTEREPGEILRAKDHSAMFIAKTWADEVRLEHILITTMSLINNDSIVEAAFMDFKELLSWLIRTKQNKKSFSVMFWILGTHWNRVKTNQPCYSPKQVINVANEILLEFQAVQQPSQPQSTPIPVHWRAPVLDMVKVNLVDALFSWEQKPRFGVVLARCLSKLHYSHVKREGNMVAFVLALFVLIVLDHRAWMEDSPPRFLSFVSSRL